MALGGNYDVLIWKIDQFIRKYYLNKLLRGLIFLGAGLFSAYIVIALSEYFGNFNTLVRTLLFYFFIILNASLFILLVIPSLLSWLSLSKTISHDEAAAIIGKHFNDVNDKLLNTLQLKKLAGNDATQRELIEASINQKIEVLKPISFPSAINIRQNTKHLKWALIPAAVICVIGLASPSILTESTRRLIKHNQYFAPVAPFNFVITNKSLAVVQGDDLPLNVKLTGNNLPADVYVQTAGNTFKLDKQNISSFKYLFTNLQQNVTFMLTANGFASQPYTIKVNLKPVLLHFDAQLTYPGYLHKSNETVNNAADLTIPAGTRIKWLFHTQNTSSLLFSINNHKIALAASNNNLFEHTESILRITNYSISPVNTAAVRKDSSTYHISVVADEMPSITVQEKPDSVSMRSLYFTGAITDDHGFSSLTFHYRIDGQGENNSRSFTKLVKADLNRTQSDFFYFWNLKDLNAKPGDRISYYFEVADNDEVSGPKKVRSAERTLNMPSEKELNDQLNAGTQQVKQKMQSAIKMAGQIERDAQKLNEMLLNKNSISFDEKKQIEDLLQKRKELEDLVHDIQAENKKNDYNRQEDQHQSQQLTEKQKQMEQLLNNLLDKNTQEMLQRLQEMMQQNYKNATQDQLQQMQQDNKSLKKELDRMLELYKKLDLQQKLDQTVNQLNKLAEDQQKLAEITEKDKANNTETQQKQQQLKTNFQDIKKSLDDLKKTDEQLENKVNFENPLKEEQAIDQKMDQSSAEMHNGKPQQAANNQKQAASQLKQLASKLKQQDREGEDQQNAIDIKQLRELLKNLVNSSFEQEKVMQTLKATTVSDPSYVSLAQKQKEIKDNLKTAEDTLYALSRRVPQIQSTVNQEITSINGHIDKALDELGDRRTAEANRDQQIAMTSMNNLALMLSDALQQLQKAAKNGSGNSKKPSMSQLAKMQQQLNQNMQKMRDQIQQQGNSGQQQSQHQGNMSEQLAKLARQQQQIRQALEQINRDENKDGRNNLGDLDKISKEMEQSERDIVNKKITDAAIKRQQQIQTRLLDAEKAEQQREQDQQRESNVGKNMPPGYIKALQDYQQQRIKQTEQLKTVSPALNLYYKQKIKTYFDQLNAK